MTDRPELRRGVSSEWVLYLQQMLNHHYRKTVVEESGSFDDALEGVVKYLQEQNNLTVDGVVRTDTWAVICGEHQMQATGEGATQEPASFAQGGQPAFKYTLPGAPLATAMVDTGVAIVEFELSMTGSVTVTFPDAPAGVTLDQSGLTATAGEALTGLTDELSIRWTDRNEPELGAAVGTKFLQVSANPLTPNCIEFSGSADVEYARPSEYGPVKVKGTVGYKLKVTVVPKTVPIPDTTPDTAERFVETHDEVFQYLLVGGLIVLGVALALPSGGGSLAAAGAAAAAVGVVGTAGADSGSGPDA